MSKHTPGPWTNGKEVYLRAKHLELLGCDLRYANFDHPETEANAKLIAAAPDLLEALIDTLDALECWTGSDIRIEKARAAIKKATDE